MIIINILNFQIKNKKKQIINDYFKTLKQIKQYENWKQSYFRNINQQIIKNSIVPEIDVLDDVKDEINSVVLQSTKFLKNEYKSNSLKI